MKTKSTNVSSAQVEGEQNYIDQAHEDWLKEKEELLEDLDYLLQTHSCVYPDEMIIFHAIEFIEKGEL